jgi:cation diffusion facilitator family transporter
LGESVKAIWAALVVNIGICLVKLAAALITGSSAMLAESFHSLADSGNQLLLLIGQRLSMRPPDVQHPFGYGKERFFWAFVVAISMFAVGATFSVYEGVKGFLQPHRITNPTINYIILGLGIFLESIALRIAYKQFSATRKFGIWRSLREAKDPALLTVIFEDSAAMVGIVLALLGIFLTQITGNAFYDSAASIVIGLMLAGIAFFLARESKDLLIGESACEADRSKILTAVHSIPEVSECMELLTMHISPEEILVNINVHFVDGLETDQIEQAIDSIERSIKTAVPAVGRIFIEADTLLRPRRQGGSVGQPDYTATDS